MTLTQIIERKRKGLLPHLPENYANRTRMEYQVLREATKACYRLDPMTRPTAYQLAQALGIAYRWRKQQKRTVTLAMIENLFRVGHHI